jgi:putative endonuclease
MYYVYIVKCSDDTYYTGCAKNVYSRIKTHNQGKGAKYTRGRLPVHLEYFEQVKNKSEALSKEYVIKKMTREQKKRLITSAGDPLIKS